MFRQAIALALILLLAPMSWAQQTVRDRIQKMSVGDKVTLRMQDGRELHGAISGIMRDDFSIDEIDQRTTQSLRYDEVASVSKGYGGKGIGGRRVNPHRALIAGLIVVGGLLVLVFVAVAADKS